MRCPRIWQVAAAIFVAGLLLRGRAREVYNMSLLLLANTGGRAWGVIRASPAPISIIHAAMLNVTSDYSQLAHLVSDFLHQPGTDPALEERFQEFLAERAAKSYPRLESALDWLLAIYKFIFPFLIISLVAKLQGQEAPCPEPNAAGGGGGSAQRPGALSRSAQREAQLPSSMGSLDLDKRRQLAISNTIASRAVAKADGGSGSSMSGGSGGGWGFAAEAKRAPDRAGSQSPSGPETPLESARLLAQHPPAAGGLWARRHAAINEIETF